MRINFKKYFLYLLRWQLSTPILAIVLIWLSTLNKWVATIIANLIGGLIFFWVDKFIFTADSLAAQWEVKEDVRCCDCGRIARGYRLVKTKNYDKTSDKAPEFRCESCSQKKAKELKKKGIKI
ncbi:MAG: hypothetical protein JRI41_01330 [Deltaproteobacteria bacterium]|nr:hypothetical protein [Deltaproteobacteria bacterium]